MKTFIKTLFLALGVTALLSSCYTSQSSTNTKDGEPAYRELADMLRKEPGVDVKGQSPNYDITIRSKGTFITSHQPLYVVDGLAMGTNYADVANAINIVDVQDINVLKGSEASSYGSRGGNGVIEIRLKKGTN